MRFKVITGQSSLPRSVRDRWPRTVPWSFVEQFREQAESNHCGQTLEVLDSRGGLGPDEMWLAFHGQGLSKFRWTIPFPGEEACGEWLIEKMREIGDIE